MSAPGYTAGMGDRRFQFSTRNALIATFWVAVFFGAVAIATQFRGSGFRDPWYKLRLMTCYSFIVVSPAAALGTICNRPVMGPLCGLVSFLGLLIADEFLV